MKNNELNELQLRIEKVKIESVMDKLSSDIDNALEDHSDKNLVVNYELLPLNGNQVMVCYNSYEDFFNTVNKLLFGGELFQSISLKRMLRTPKYYFEFIKNYTITTEAKTVTEKNFHPPINTELDLTKSSMKLNKLHKTITSLFTRENFSGFIDSSTEELDSQFEDINYELIQSIVYSFIESRFQQEIDHDVGEKLDDIRQALFQIEKAVSQNFFISYLYPWIVGIALLLIPVSSERQPINFIHKNEIRQRTKDANKSINLIVKDKSALDSFRLITASRLNVRKNGNNKSDVIATLNLNTVVRIINKYKSWTLIRWQVPDSDVVIQGWVYSRYLKKLV